MHYVVGTRRPIAISRQTPLYRGLGYLAGDRVGAYFAYPDPWAAFVEIARAQSATPATNTIPRQAIKARLKYDYDYWMARANAAIVIASKVSEPELAGKFLAKAQALIAELKDWAYVLPQADTIDLEVLKARFRDLNDVWDRIWVLHTNMQAIDGGISVIDQQAASEARATMAKLTAQDLAYIKQKAGFWSDAQYEALLKQQFYMSKLVNAYADKIKAVGPDVTNFLSDRMAENARAIEDSKPTAMSATLDDPLAAAGKVYEAAKDKLPSFEFFGNIGKWGIMIVGGTVILGGFLAVGGFKAIFGKKK